MSDSPNNEPGYNNPPVEEAMCEFRFLPEIVWDPTLPGRLQVELDDYAGSSRELRALQIQFPGEGGNGADMQFSDGLQRVQLVTPNGHRVVAVGPNALSIHMLRPYSHDPGSNGGGWKEFKQRIQQALTAYASVINQKRGVVRVGVRYINKIIVPVEIQQQETYLNCGLRSVDGLSDFPVSVSSRAEYSYPHEMRLIVSYGNVFPNTNEQAALLDLDGIWQSQQPIDTNESLAIIDSLHEIVEKAFEALITEECRSSFNAV